MMTTLHKTWVIGLCLIAAVLAGGQTGSAQSVPSPASSKNGQPDAQDLNGKIERLTTSLEQTQTELARSRSEIEQLRTMLGVVLKRMDNAQAAVAPQANVPEATVPGDVTSIAPAA